MFVSNPTREKPCPRPISETCQPCPGKLFPSGNLVDTIKMDDGTSVDVTTTDMTNPCVFFKPADFGLGLTGLELSNPDGTLTGSPGVQDRLGVESELPARVAET